jgi:hypothetical protein
MDEQINTQEEIKNSTRALTQPPEETVGDIMQKMSADGLKWIVIVGSIAVYVAMVIYAEVHGLNMMTQGVAPDFLIWAYVGMVAVGFTALLLPLALKVWTIEARHRITAMLFYAVDLALLGVNAFTDYGTNTGAQLASWAQLYKAYIMPATPVIAGMGWSILWMLDPDVKDKINRLTLRAAMKQKMAQRVAEAAKGATVTARVNAAAEREVDRALTELFGTPVTGYVMDAQDIPQRRGLLQSFFDFLYSFRQPEPLGDTPTQSQPSDSSKEPQDSPKE